MSESVKIIRKGVMRQVTTTIPAREVVNEVEVDTLKEFLQEVELTEDQVRLAIKEFKEDKVTQPTYKMDDLQKIWDEGLKKAQKYLTSDFKESKVVVSDPYVADALTSSERWKCVNKSKGKYFFERV